MIFVSPSYTSACYILLVVTASQLDGCSYLKPVDLLWKKRLSLIELDTLKAAKRGREREGGRKERKKERKEKKTT